MSEPTSNAPKPKGILSRFALDPGAWQPFTGGGVSRFAQAGIWRASIALGLGSLAAGLAVGWLLHSTWWPVLQQAASRFPESPVLLRSGRLDWKEPNARVLAEGPQLGIAYRPAGSEPVGLTADLQAELTPAHLRVVGIAGYLDLPWHPQIELELDRRDAMAGWGAWRLPVLATAVLVASASVFLLGITLASTLCLPLWLIQLLFRRGLSPGGAWKLIAAAHGPAALVLAAAFAAYSVRWISWPGLLLAVVAHPGITLSLILWGLFRLEPAPRAASPAVSETGPGPGPKSGPQPKPKALKGNPFKPQGSNDSKASKGSRPGGKKKNPFHGDSKD